MDAMKTKLWRESQLGERPQRTWDEACVRWLKENADKRDYAGDCEKIAWLQQFFSGRLLSAMTSDLIYDVVETHKADVKGATRNRYYALIRAIMRCAAAEWKWIDLGQVPHVRMHRESKGRTRYLEPDEFRRLLRELTNHWRSVVAFAVETGLRSSNVVNLRWSEVDLAQGHAIIPRDKTKNDRTWRCP
jgi:integrase